MDARSSVRTRARIDLERRKVSTFRSWSPLPRAVPPTAALRPLPHKPQQLGPWASLVADLVADLEDTDLKNPVAQRHGRAQASWHRDT